MGRIRAFLLLLLLFSLHPLPSPIVLLPYCAGLLLGYSKGFASLGIGISPPSLSSGSSPSPRNMRSMSKPDSEWGSQTSLCGQGWGQRALSQDGWLRGSLLHRVTL